MKAPSPTKGVAPVFTGVPGVLIDSIPEDVVFGERKLKTSPYDPLLLQLKAAGAGKFLCFEDLRARPSLAARAKKLAIKILFGEKGPKLYVSLAKVDLTTEGAADEQPRLTASDIIILALKAGRTTAGEIVTWARSNGAPGLGITQVDSLLSSLTRAGKVKLKPARPGADAPDRWSIA